MSGTRVLKAFYIRRLETSAIARNSGGLELPAAAKVAALKLSPSRHGLFA
jgi:hypothetical protein